MTTSRSRCLFAAAVCATLFTVLLAVVAGSWGPLVHGDQAVENHLSRYASMHGALVHGARDISSIGRPLVFQALAGVVTIALFIGRRIRAASALAVALGSELLAGHFVKVLVDRHRPTVAAPGAFARGPSFPSSHALASATVVTTLVMILCAGVGAIAARWVVAVGAVLVIVVGLSRLVLAVHYPSDVAAGWLLGAAIALACIAGADRPARSRDRPTRSAN